MIIKKIEIQNFRSYYKDNKFDFIDGLNLIIGSNGDGKTTFYEALEWLFRTDGANKMDTNYISKKRTEELFPNDSDDVRVAMTYEHNGRTKILEKMFHFTKSFDEEVNTSNYAFSLIEQNGIEREIKDGVFFDKDISSEMRTFMMFKGEDDLNIMEKSNSLKLLIDNFGEVKNFDAYFSFMEYAIKNADKARDHAQSSDRKNEKDIKSFKTIIDNETSILLDIDKEIRLKENEATNFDSLLKNIERSRDSSKLLVSTNQRIKSLQDKRAETAARIKENYTINLLDDMWILMGFKDIANEYSCLISEIDQKSRQLEQDYLVTEGQKRAIKKMKTDFVPLPANIPGRTYLQEMLNEEVCKICGRRAEKHSDAWEFMKHRLDEFEASLKDDVDNEILPFYENHYISELRNRNSVLESQLPETSQILRKIKEMMALNNRLHNEIKKIDANIENEFEQKKRILAQADGLSEEQLLANYDNISDWVEKKRLADNRIDVLRKQREEHRGKLENAQISLSKISKGTAAEIYAKTAMIIHQISEAFRTAKELNKSRLLTSIEDEANLFLEKLNTNDFKGTIRIVEKQSGQCETFLKNDDDIRIFNPNTALKTTYLMSILFAIGKLSSEKDKTKIPLLFDAPTSSFTDTKENEFFNVISSLGKQVIIVTKSFLRDDNKGDVFLDSARVDKINGRVFRIEKKKPFDDKKLGTIQTVISKIK